MKKVVMLAALVFSMFFVACKNNQVTRSEVKEVSISEASKLVGDEKYLFVDLRSVDEYIGWPIGIVREGHIKGAIDFPESWFELIGSNKKLVAELNRRNITTDKNLILYTRDGEVDKNIVKRLSDIGYEEVSTLKDGIKEWALNEPLPMEKLKGYKMYVYPEWVDNVIDGKEVLNYDGRDFVVVEVNEKRTSSKKMRNSIFIDYSLLETEEMWNKPSDQVIEEILVENGISKDTMVIIYGPNLMASNRCAALMKYAGIEDVRILNGGTKRLELENYPFVKGYIEPTPIESFGTKVPANPEVLIDFYDEMRILKDENGVIASIRSWAEHTGQITGYTYIHEKGDIAEARFGYAGSDPYHMEDYRNVDNTLFNYKIIEDRWNKWGITSDKEVAFHCGTGWRASEAYFVAKNIGWENIHVYDGGWYEWHIKKAPKRMAGVPLDAPEIPLAKY